jgi:aspartate ammonia-lyase
MPATRIEHDFLGERTLPADAYYGIQTLRALENFNITGIPIKSEPLFVQALAYVKKAAAQANRDLGVLDASIADAIMAACDKVIAGELNDQFQTDMIQGGAGTSVLRAVRSTLRVSASSQTISEASRGLMVVTSGSNVLAPLR